MRTNSEKVLQVPMPEAALFILKIFGLSDVLKFFASRIPKFQIKSCDFLMQYMMYVVRNRRTLVNFPIINFK